MPHLGLAFFLLVQEFALTGRIAAVAFCRDVLAHGAHGFAGDDLAADGGLDRDHKQMGRDQLFELFAHQAAA